MNLKVNYHLLLCASSSKEKCCTSSEGLPSWKKLKEIIKELGLESPVRPEGIVLRSKVDCLRVCGNGPILLTWPDGIWYQRVTPQRIEKIIHEHIINNKPIEEWIIKRTKLNIKQSYSNL